MTVNDMLKVVGFDPIRIGNIAGVTLFESGKNGHFPPVDSPLNKKQVVLVDVAYNELSTDSKGYIGNGILRIIINEGRDG